MCGRFTLTADAARLQERFACDLTALPYTPSYNIAPSQEVLALVNTEENQATYLRWGLIPAWATDPRIGHRLINARAETVAEKSSFRQALRQRRCLILADGFYEWQRTDAGKTPMYMRLRDHQPFALAGLWEVWHDTSGTMLTTCTILTTAANDLMRPIHARMPVILPPAAAAVWLDRDVTTPEKLLPWLTPYESADMEAYAVSPAVNSPRHNTPACIAPVSAIP
jgi:putative SOS response-associated peptidase YedK